MGLPTTTSERIEALVLYPKTLYVEIKLDNQSDPDTTLITKRL
jgi:hypothetical protein